MKFQKPIDNPSKIWYTEAYKQMIKNTEVRV